MARAKRVVMTPSMAPIAVSKNAGATANWIAWAIEPMAGSTTIGIFRVAL
jgi:hypothetical protein